MTAEPLDEPALLTLLDEDVRRIARMMREAGVPALHEMGVEGARQMMTNAPRQPGPALDSVEDRSFSGPYGSVSVRIYRPMPKSRGLQPAVLYFHGGGMVIGDLDSYDSLCRELAFRSRTVIVSVGYRLAPEHTYPVANEEAFSALEWLAREAVTLGLDPAQLGLAGDSAGGGLAAATALMARDRGGPPVKAQFLLYAGVDRIEGYDSALMFANAPFLTTQDVSWMKNLYLGSDPAADDPYGVPARASTLAGLPPAVVVTAEVDPVRDSVESYGRRLQADRVPTVFLRYPGVCHGFLSQYGVFGRADQALNEIAALIGVKMKGGFQCQR